MASQGVSLLRRSLSSSFSSSSSSAIRPCASPANYMPCRAMSRLFVGALSFTTEEEGLRTAFSKFGEVLDAKIVKDRETGRSRGFGFVTFMTDGDAETAMNKMNGQFLDGRVIRVDRAAPRPAPPPRLTNPVVESTPDEPVAEDWGTIPSPMAAVPQNAGLADGVSTASNYSSPPHVSTTLPDLSTLAASSTNNTPDSGASNNTAAASSPFSFDTSTPTKASTKDTGPSFNFIDLNLSNLPPPDPNQVPRRRPPRMRSSSMADYEFGYYMSENSKFPFNTNFATGIPRSSGPEFDFDFEDIKKVNAIKQAEWKAAKEAKMAEEAAKKAAEEAAAAAQKAEEEAANQAAEEASKQDKDADVVAKEGDDDKQHQSNVECKTVSETGDYEDKGDEKRPEEKTLVADENGQNATNLESASAKVPQQTAQESHPSSTDAPQAAYGS